jgi:AcrR family transcriptional regulator
LNVVGVDIGHFLIVAVFFVRHIPALAGMAGSWLDFRLSSDKSRKSSVLNPQDAVPANPADRPGPEEMRARILEAAWDLFRQLGARTTIADIAEKLGMSSANVYRFYPSKQAVCEAIASNQLSALTAKTREIASGSGLASEKFRRGMLMMYECMCDQMLNQSRVHEIVDVAIHENWSAIETFKHDLSAIVAELIAEGQSRGEFGPGEPLSLAAQALCACAGVHHPTLIAQFRNSPTAVPPADVVDFALRALSYGARSVSRGGDRSS